MTFFISHCFDTLNVIVEVSDLMAKFLMKVLRHSKVDDI
jgi:hypothetical protein